MAETIARVMNILGDSTEAIVHEFEFGPGDRASGALIYLDGLVDRDALHKSILQPLMYEIPPGSHGAPDYRDAAAIKARLLSVSDVTLVSTIEALLEELMAGLTILVVEGSSSALAIDVRQWASRPVEAPQTENVVRGPRQGFTENLKENIALVRRILKDTDLTIERMTIGERTKTAVVIVYLRGIAAAGLVDEVRTRLARIRADAILESGYIEQYIEDAPYSIFATVGNTEKPDKMVAKILEGRVAIMTDGTPIVLTVPLFFLESFQSAEDYYSRPIYASLTRLTRFLSFVISVFAPATYVALTTFHQELIPTPLLIALAAGHQNVPFPALFEALIMLITFEIMREAGVRLPRPVGSAVSIVGALVLGESAVSAGLIGPFMVIIVAITAIASFVLPAQTDSMAVLRYVFLVLAALAGGFGLLMGCLVVLIHMASLRSFGAPFLFPLAPLTPKSLRDTFVRMPLWAMPIRPSVIASADPVRQGPNTKPAPDERPAGQGDAS